MSRRTSREEEVSGAGARARMPGGSGVFAHASIGVPALPCIPALAVHGSGVS